MLLGQLVDKLPPQHLRRKDDSLIDSDTLLGVEIEVEGCTKTLPSNNTRTGYWESKEDHSLRDLGREFVFREPLFGADAVAAITYLCECANQFRWKISERTGIHVHVDVRGMEVEKFQNFCILYPLVEKPLYKWVGDNRDTNIHCLPWYMADGDLNSIGGIFREPKYAITTIKGLNRYSGLNLHSLSMFGTAEFRQLKTTFDKDRILTWINLILSIRQAAIAWQGKPEELIKEMRILGAFGFLNRVFGKYTSLLWYPEFEKDFRGISIPTAHHILKNTTYNNLKDEKIFIQMKTNEKDEQGDNPGVLKWKKKAKPAPKRKTRTITLVNGQTLNLGTPPDSPLNLWLNQLNPPEEDSI